MYRHEKELWARVLLAGILYVALLTTVVIEMRSDIMTRSSCLSIISAIEWLPTQYGEYPRGTDLLIHEMAHGYNWSFASDLLQPQYYGNPQMIWDADSNLKLTQHDRSLARAGDLLYWSNGQIIHLGYLNRFGVVIRII